MPDVFEIAELVLKRGATTLEEDALARAVLAMRPTQEVREAVERQVKYKGYVFYDQINEDNAAISDAYLAALAHLDGAEDAH